MKVKAVPPMLTLFATANVLIGSNGIAQAQGTCGKPPNILVIMGADVRLPAQAVIASVLKSTSYETGQFRKSHLGDLNMNCVHGFDEFFGYLFHLGRDVRSILVRLPAGTGAGSCDGVS